MSASQRPVRKRDAQTVFDEEETRPVKKAKPNTTVAKASNGRKSTEPKKAKASTYDRNVDGFEFTSAATRKTRSASAKESAQTPAPPAQTIPTAAKSVDMPPPQSTRQKKPKADPKSDTSVEHATKATTEPRRKSSRNSTEAPLPQDQSQREASPTKEVKTRRKTAKTPVAEKEKIAEERRGPSKIPLPFADTPVITRNKEMRKHSAEGHRRSSSSMRGRRASSLIDSGTSNAMPHSEVAKEEFYKHISQDLPEPRRMQQLLSWCGTRVIPERPTDAPDDGALTKARIVQLELLKDFAKRSELSDWFSREDLTPVVLVKKPNPRNVQNAAKLQELEREVKRLTEEKQAWDKVLSSLKSSSSSHKLAIEDIKKPGPENLQAAALDQPDQGSIIARLLAARDAVKQAPERLKEATDRLEFKLDTVAEGVHSLHKLRESAEMVVGSILGNASSALQQRDQAAIQEAGTAKVGISDILRSLSRT